MKKSLLWVLCGLVVFAAIYAFVIPDSNMPVRVKVEKTWQIDNPISDIIFESENYKISQNSIFQRKDEGWENIGYPNGNFSDRLPEGLSWPKPEILFAGELDGTLFLKFSGEKVATFKNSWGYEVKNTKIEFTPVKQLERTSSGEIIEIDGNICFKFSDFEKRIETMVEKTKIKKNTEIYQITDDGRIKNTETDGLSSRDNFDPFLVPTKIIQTEDSVFALMQSTSNHSPKNWVYTFSKDLELTGKIVKNKQSYPIDFTLWENETILIIWDNGLLSGHTLWGQEKFQFEITKKLPLDMAVAGEQLFVLTNEECLSLTLTSRKPEVEVWPRILNLGNISESSIHSVFIKTDNFPRVAIKGKGISIKSISEENDGFLAKIEVDPKGLPAFKKISGELLIETGKNHEVVPYIFFATGKIKKYRIFSNQLLDLDTGEFTSYTIDNEKLLIENMPEDSKTYTDYLSGYVFLLSPSPLNDLN